MYKKACIILSLMLISQLGFGQKNVNQLFKEFAKADNTTSVNIGKITMTFASLFTETMGVNGIEVFSLDECAQSMKDEFSKAVKSLKDSEYETMVRSNEDGDNTRVLVKMKDDMIKELVVITSGSSNALVRIKGNIKPSDIDRVVNKHGNEH